MHHITNRGWAAVSALGPLMLAAACHAARAATVHVAPGGDDAAAGTAGAPLRLQAAPGRRPVLDFSRLKPSDEKARGTARGVFLAGDHWILEGLEICRAPDNGIKIEGSHNRVDRCVFHHNGDSGLQIGLAKKSRNDGSLAAHNAVVNCDSFRNFDARTKGENADGFACKLYPGAGNSFAGCRAWENADDGWDLS